MITLKMKGDFSKTKRYFQKLLDAQKKGIFDKYGALGVQALASATPVRTGATASAWSYEVHSKGSGVSIQFFNSNVNKGVNIAVILQEGHGTGTGGYVVGRDYINPAIQPVFDQMVNDIWKEVASL